MTNARKFESNAERQAAYRQRQAEARRQEQEAKNLPALPSVPTMPGVARWRAMHGQAVTLLETLRDEMQSYHDERSSEWQDGERGQAMQEQIGTIEEAITAAQECEL